MPLRLSASGNSTVSSRRTRSHHIAPAFDRQVVKIHFVPAGPPAHFISLEKPPKHQVCR
jgi:hypothetical protein